LSFIYPCCGAGGVFVLIVASKKTRRGYRPSFFFFFLVWSGSSPSAPKTTLGSVPCAFVLVSPLYYKPAVSVLFQSRVAAEPSFDASEASK